MPVAASTCRCGENLQAPSGADDPESPVLWKTHSAQIPPRPFYLGLDLGPWPVFGLYCVVSGSLLLGQFSKNLLIALACLTASLFLPLMSTSLA